MIASTLTEEACVLVVGGLIFIAGPVGTAGLGVVADVVVVVVVPPLMVVSALVVVAAISGVVPPPVVVSALVGVGAMGFVPPLKAPIFGFGFTVGLRIKGGFFDCVPAKERGGGSVFASSTTAGGGDLLFDVFADAASFTREEAVVVVAQPAFVGSADSSTTEVSESTTFRVKAAAAAEVSRSSAGIGTTEGEGE